MSIEIKSNIQKAIMAFSNGTIFENGVNLFNKLGYSTERTSRLFKPDYEGFRNEFLKKDSNFNKDKALVTDWLSVHFLFQLTKEEVLKQTSLFDTKKVDNQAIESYLFFAIELKGSAYSRTQLANIIREVNKVFAMPVMILFKYGEFITLSVINRRINKKDENKDVLLKVTLIKDISIKIPHRAHIEILFDLSFDELKDKYQFTNFIELHNAWQTTLDIKELNKRFFKELANWYFWATKRCVFPDDELKDKNIRNATNVIRLITRLIFVWFLKEKKLVPDELFDQKILKDILKYNDQNKSTFYKAILQNLFFATLNTEMGKRKFRSKSDNSQNSHYFIHNLFRYRSEFYEPEDVLKKYFEPIPFLNGGLFECLDKEVEINGKLKRIRIDGFSDRKDNTLKVPDELFFMDKEKEIDLNDIYGTKNKKYYVRGLFAILNNYKFTVAENTPIEEEVALDPELLGRVFENLLANYNPETQTTARKQTGSFYTPREIVNYMVDESLIAYLNQKHDDLEIYESKLRDLISYSDNPIQFNLTEREKLINAIDNVKILDPACGSGAFPMGILHKLVHILHKIDPGNELWKQRQIEKAEKIDDAPGRDAAIHTIEEAFENNELDYGRKLYLIENCIYGVDIQPIAVQIAKLRFFISLIVDQNINKNNENIGIRPLPNLETKFVAANALIGLKSETANLFTNEQIIIKKEKLKSIRHSYFEARTPKRKQKCREADKKLRDELAELLIDSHNIQPDNAKLLAAWDPYDQNISAPFFEPEWMFSINDGFDIVIGNPPYIRVQNLAHEEIDIYKTTWQTAWKRIDISTLFMELGYSLLRDNGNLCFISSNQFLSTEYGQKMREFLIKKGILKTLIDFGDLPVFDNTLTYVSIFILSKNIFVGFDYQKIQKLPFQKPECFNFINYSMLSADPWSLGDNKEMIIIKNVQSKYDKLKKYAKCWTGVITGNDDLLLFNINEEVNYIEEELFIPVIRAQGCERYYYAKPSKKVFYPYYQQDNETKLYNLSILEQNYPKAYKFIMENKSDLISRKDSRKTLRNKVGWYGLIRFGKLDTFKKYKLVSPGEVKSNKFSLDVTGSAFSGARVFSITVQSNLIDILYLLALLNSKFIEFYLHKTAPLKQGGYYSYSSNVIDSIPLAIEKENSKFFVSIVKYIFEFKKSKKDASFFERLIDAMVYELYLSDIVKKAGCEIMKHLNNTMIGENENNLDMIDKILKELSSPNHPVSIAMFKMDTIEEIRIIEGKQ